MRTHTPAGLASPPRPVRERMRRAAPGAGLESFCLALCHDVRGPLATAGAALERLALLPMLAPAPSRGAALARAAAPHGARPDALEAATDAEDGASGRELLSIAHRSLACAEELLSALPDLLAIERAPRLEAVALADCVEAARADVAVDLQVAGGRVAVDGSLPVVLAHRERLRIALRNLLRNAIRHRRPGVALEIALRAATCGRGATLLVADNGSGVPARDRARIFAALERGSAPRGDGLGLGLAIARGAVAACGGRLALLPADPPGATFAISLRAAGSGAAASRS